MNNNNDIFKQWYQERARESKASFKLALGLATTTGIFGLVAGVSLCIGNVSATAATTAAGLVSGVASHRAFKLYEQASQSLDDAAKTLLDNEGVWKLASADTDNTSDTGIDTGNDTDTTAPDKILDNTGGSSGIGQIPESGIDTNSNTKRYTPAFLTREQMLILIQQRQSHMSQTQLIQDLWCVEKNKQGWKQAYAEYKELTGES